MRFSPCSVPTQTAPAPAADFSRATAQTTSCESPSAADQLVNCPCPTRRVEAAPEEPEPERALAVDDRGERRLDRQALAAADQPPRRALARGEALHRRNQELAAVVEGEAPDLARLGQPLVGPLEALGAPGKHVEVLDRADPEPARRVGLDVVQIVSSAGRPRGRPNSTTRPDSFR